MGSQLWPDVPQKVRDEVLRVLELDTILAANCVRMHARIGGTAEAERLSDELEARLAALKLLRGGDLERAFLKRVAMGLTGEREEDDV